MALPTERDLSLLHRNLYCHLSPGGRKATTKGGGHEMKMNMRVAVMLCFLLIGIGVILSALQWPSKAALLPIILGSFVSVMALIELYFILIRKAGEPPRGIDIDHSTGLDKVEERRRILSIFIWMFGFLFLFLLLGFNIATGVYLFLYLKFSGKERWLSSLGLTAIIWVSFYFFFIWLSAIQFPKGLLQEWLGL